MSPVEQLVTENLKLVPYTIRKRFKYPGKQVMEEWIAIGNVALCLAAKTYNPNKGYTFSTYAMNVIRNQIVKDYFVYNGCAKRKLPDGCKIFSLDQPYEQHHDIHGYYELIPSEDERVDQLATNRAMVDSILSKLDEKDKTLLTLKFGLDGSGYRTHEELGKEIGKPLSTAGQAVQSVIRKIKRLPAVQEDAS